MVRHLVISIGLVAFCNMACADVTAMDNTELAAAALPAQQEQQQMPVLPEYNADGQIGGVATTLPIPVVGGALGTPAETPVASSSGSPGGLALQLPLASAINQLLNFATHNR